MQNNRKIGGKYEEVAKDYLIKQGYQIVESNYFCKAGEIDLIAREKEYLVFIEVKYRKNQKTGTGLEAVSIQKQKTISRCALFYIMEHQLNLEVPIRFDVVSIDKEQMTLIKNAFFYQGSSL